MEECVHCRRFTLSVKKSLLIWDILTNWKQNRLWKSRKKHCKMSLKFSAQDVNWMEFCYLCGKKLIDMWQWPTMCYILQKQFRVFYRTNIMITFMCQGQVKGFSNVVYFKILCDHIGKCSPILTTKCWARADPGIQAAIHLAIGCHYFCQSCGYFPSRRASPPTGRYHIIVLSEKRHMCVSSLLKAVTWKQTSWHVLWLTICLALWCCLSFRHTWEFRILHLLWNSCLI